jgi:hypothetical protein
MMLTVHPPLRILRMAANPSDLPSLDVKLEKQRVEEAIKDLKKKGLVNITWLSGQTWENLQHAMRNGIWHIFHFIKLLEMECLCISYRIDSIK